MTDPDFMRLRQAILFYLKGIDEGKTGGRHALRDGLAATEWRAINMKRRVWALGAAAGDSVPFEEAEGVASTDWKELDEGIRKVLAERILQWVRV